MSETIDEITVNYEEDGVLLCKEIKKEILSRGAWTTIMFLYQDFNRASSSYKEEKISIRRYQKRNGTYIPRSKFNISSKDQAGQIANKIREWYQLTNS